MHTDVYCAGMVGVPRHTGKTRCTVSGSDENGFSRNDTVTNNPEAIVNVGHIAGGEWLRYTVDVTYISEIESTKRASVEQ